MSESCNHDCSSCASKGSCSKPESLLVAPHETSNIKKVYAIVSGKGGVGKSMITTMMAVTMQRRGCQAAVLDADITGPSIPKMLGLTGKRAETTGENLLPVKTKSGIEVMSVNLLLDKEESPVVWRGPVISGAVKQFWQDVLWNDVDYMFVDMPPGTGDVPLTVFQSLPVDGIIIVTSPQQLVGMVVAKAVQMANMMNIPIVGVVENYSYYECPHCGEKVHLFGEGNLEKTLKDYNLPLLARLPINPDLAKAADAGLMELFEGDWLEQAADTIEA